MLDKDRYAIERNNNEMEIENEKETIKQDLNVLYY